MSFSSSEAITRVIDSAEHAKIYGSGERQTVPPHSSGTLTEKERQTVLRLLENEEEKLARMTASSSAEDDK